jgi:hypothetical protein
MSSQPYGPVVVGVDGLIRHAPGPVAVVRGDHTAPR